MTEKERYRRAARKLRALAHPARLKLLEKIATDRCCVSELEKCLALSQPNVSQHLRILKQAGIVKGTREKSRICYRISDDRVRGLIENFLKGEH